MMTIIILLLLFLTVYCVRKKTTPKLVFMRFELYVKLILIRLHIL